MELTVKLQVFEGPLDLLLHLLEKNEDGRTSRVSGMTIEEYRC